MTCRSTTELLPLFVEGDLPPRKAERVRQHVEACLGCRGRCQEYRQSQQWLRASAGPTVGGAALDQLRRSVWRRIQDEPRPAPLWLAIERGWAALRRWASQPAVAGLAVMLVVVGSVTFTRVGGLGRSHLVEGSLGVDLDPGVAVRVHDGAEDPEILAQASNEELSEAREPGESEPAAGAAGDDAMRIEIQTRDPNVRIIWFTPKADQPAVEN